MAGFLAVRDPDPARRAAAARVATERLVDAGLSSTGTVERADTLLVWGTRPGAPVERDADVVVLGELLDVRGRLSARAWRDSWSGDGAPAPTDGFHLAMALDADGTLTVDADLLGLFPVHHWTEGEVALAGSSPHLLRAHPALRPVLDLRALVGVLAADGQVGSATVLRDVHRVAPGRVLRLPSHGAPFELDGYVLPITADLHDVAPMRHLADRFHDSLVAACRRHLDTSTATALLLSGGLDSRLLAGALRTAGIAYESVTFGAPTDTEQQFAKRVADHLGVPHRLVPDHAEPEAFERGIRWEGLVATPSLDHPAVDPRFDRIVSGFAMDATAGGSHIDWAYDPTTGARGFEPFFARVNRHGVAVDALRRLLRPDVFGSALDEALEDVRRTFDAGGDSDAERAWRYDLAHRQRFWVGPRVPRQMASSWPSLPHVDRELLALVGAMPLAVIASRTLEIEACKAHHPDLARLPLDRATFEVTALVPRAGDLVRGAVARRVRDVRARTPWPARETRYFTRIFDIEGDAWREARRRLEPARDAARSLFTDELDRLLPPPTAPWPGLSSYPEANGAKMLLAVMAMLDDGVAW